MSLMGWKRVFPTGSFQVVQLSADELSFGVFVLVPIADIRSYLPDFTNVATATCREKPLCGSAVRGIGPRCGLSIPGIKSIGLQLTSGESSQLTSFGKLISHQLPQLLKPKGRQWPSVHEIFRGLRYPERVRILEILCNGLLKVRCSHVKSQLL